MVRKEEQIKIGKGSKMEITSGMIYWITRLDSICVALAMLFGVFGFWLVVCLCTSFSKHLDAVTKEQTAKAWEWFKFAKKPLICLCVCWVLGCFIPTTKQAAAIIVVPPIVNNEQVRELPNKLLELGNEWLDELRPEKEK